MGQIVIIIITGLVSALSLGIIVINFDPFQAAGYIKLLFFLSLFAMIWGVSTIALFYFSKSNKNLEKSFWRGFLISGSLLAIFLVTRLILYLYVS